MLLGQYSTGKTTFIKHLLKCSYPGKLSFVCASVCMQAHFRLKSFICFIDYLISLLSGAHIGPEPTTDRFVVVMVSAKPPPLVLLHNVVLSYLPLNNFFIHDSTLFSKQFSYYFFFRLNINYEQSYKIFILVSNFFFFSFIIW
jgi:hypothetical protein